MATYADVTFSPDDHGWYASIIIKEPNGDFRPLGMVPPGDSDVAQSRKELVEMIINQWPTASIMGD